MTANDLPPDVTALINHASIHEVQAEIDEAQARYQQAADVARKADAELAKAYAAIPELTQRAVSGERVSAAIVAKAHARVRDAEAYRDFCAEVARRLAPDEREAAGRMSAAKARAYAAVLDHGVDLRIAAAARADRADGNVDRNPTTRSGRGQDRLQGRQPDHPIRHPARRAASGLKPTTDDAGDAVLAIYRIRRA